MRQNGLDRLYNAFVKKVPPDLAGELVSSEKEAHVINNPKLRK